MFFWKPFKSGKQRTLLRYSHYSLYRPHPQCNLPSQVPNRARGIPLVGRHAADDTEPSRRNGIPASAIRPVLRGVAWAADVPPEAAVIPRGAALRTTCRAGRRAARDVGASVAGIFGEVPTACDQREQRHHDEHLHDSSPLWTRQSLFRPRTAMYRENKDYFLPVSCLLSSFTLKMYHRSGLQVKNPTARGDVLIFLLTFALQIVIDWEEPLLA